LGLLELSNEMDSIPVSAVIVESFYFSFKVVQTATLAETD
jgi:hypothetical protein